MKQSVLIPMLSVMIALTAWITVPAPVPFTLQTLGVCLTVCLLGARGGLLSTGLYLLLGAFGLPVFAGMNGGAGVLTGPTGGYLIGFLAMVLVAGLLMGKSPKPLKTGVSLVAGLAACYAVGTAWYAYGYGGSVGSVLLTCVVPFVLPDMLKIAVAVMITAKLRPILQKMGWQI